MPKGYAEESEHGGWWSWVKDRMGVNEYEESDEYEDHESPEPVPRRRGVLLRLHAPRLNEISVRMNIASLDDAKDAADRLKARQPVILNLEHTEDSVAERVVDFVSGVTYALDGYYQKVGDKVFLFTPESTAINVEENHTRSNRAHRVGE